MTVVKPQWIIEDIDDEIIVRDDLGEFRVRVYSHYQGAIVARALEMAYSHGVTDQRNAVLDALMDEDAGDD